MLPCQVMVTCAGRILTKHWLGAQKSRFACDWQAKSLSPKVMANIAFQTPKHHGNEIDNQAKSGQDRSRHLATCAGCLGANLAGLAEGSYSKTSCKEESALENSSSSCHGSIEIVCVSSCHHSSCHVAGLKTSCHVPAQMLN